MTRFDHLARNQHTPAARVVASAERAAAARKAADAVVLRAAAAVAATAQIDGSKPEPWHWEFAL